MAFETFYELILAAAIISVVGVISFSLTDWRHLGLMPIFGWRELVYLRHLLDSWRRVFNDMLSSVETAHELLLLEFLARSQ